MNRSEKNFNMTLNLLMRKSSTGATTALDQWIKISTRRICWNNWRRIKYSLLLTGPWSTSLSPFSETQSEWFGKQGLSWHVSSALFPEKEKEWWWKKTPFEIRSYVHLVENGTQGWFTISQILHHTLCMLKEQKPNTKSEWSFYKVRQCWLLQLSSFDGIPVEKQKYDWHYCKRTSVK